tara:strand:- start:8248 stop:8577 length:330 start_codon:yes stop_codon:yes gene_type:complete
MNKKIITLDEFFRFKEMFRGSDEDIEVALAIWNSQYKDKKLLDILMCKALVFNDRVKFSIAVKHKFTIRKNSPSMQTQSLYAFIEAKKLHQVYADIIETINNKKNDDNN